MVYVAGSRALQPELPAVAGSTGWTRQDFAGVPRREKRSAAFGAFEEVCEHASSLTRGAQDLGNQSHGLHCPGAPHFPSLPLPSSFKGRLISVHLYSVPRIQLSGFSAKLCFSIFHSILFPAPRQTGMNEKYSYSEEGVNGRVLI